MMPPNISQFISHDQITALNRPTASATGLPGTVYTDKDFWELERRDYFPSRWMACAHESDLPAPGDVMPVTIGGYELILTRDQDDLIHAFYNVCAHRGMRVLKSKQSGQHTLRTR